MGIRGLAHLLEPYRVAVDFFEVNEQMLDDVGASTTSDASSSSPRRRESVVIDGPALAYHAYYAALSSRTSARNALEAMPSYAEVNAKALEMLDTLQKHGLDISAIFFDGALPESKREVRMHRLNSYLAQMQKYRSLHAKSSSSAGDGRMNYCQGAEDSNPFSPALQVPVKFKSLPASPFLVPAVIEALQRSAYAAVTAVIPGEADYFCAAYASKHSAMILTSDSDLLAYELHADSSVVLLRDIEYRPSENLGTRPRVFARLKIRRFEPSSIAKQLELRSLTPFAFAVQDDSNRSIKQYIEVAMLLQQDPSMDCRQFAAQYSTERLTADKHLNVKKLAQSQQGHLDPRVSELYHSMMNPGMHEMLPNELSLLHYYTEMFATYCMYLPVLIEDPTRESAWNPSADIRAFVYTVMQRSRKVRNPVFEYMRRGDRIAQFKVELMPNSEILTSLQQFTEYFDHVLGLGYPDRSLRWPFLAIHHLCMHARSNGKPLPTKYVLKAMLTKRPLCHDWEYIHWYARMQGVIYSLRMMDQCFQVLLSAGIKYSTRTMYDPEIERILERLVNMPTIPGWFTEASDIDANVLEGTLNLLFKDLGIIDERSYEQAAVAATSKRSRKRQRRTERDSQGRPAKVTTSSNMFNVLSNAGHSIGFELRTPFHDDSH